MLSCAKKNAVGVLPELEGSGTAVGMEGVC